MTGVWLALGALPLVLGVQKKSTSPHAQNIATLVLPDGQVVLDGDTYATVVASDGTEHAELEQRKHYGYAQHTEEPAPAEAADGAAADGAAAKPGTAGGGSDVTALAGPDAAKFNTDSVSPEDARGCEDTEGWVNGFTGPAQSLADYWLEAEAEIEKAGHKGVMLWIKDKGNTCAAYVFMGLCVNMKWIDDTEADWPCIMDGEMSGAQWNHPEEHCCACGKAHVSKGSECSNETKVKVWKNVKEMLATVGDAFEGSEDAKLANEFGLGAAVSLLALSALL